MVSKKRSPHIYWSQTESEVSIKIDLKLDDMQPNIKIKAKSLLLDAYGFGSSDDIPNFYFFEIDLYEAVDVEVSMDSITSTDTELQFRLKKVDDSKWWSRLTAQPQKQNWIHIDEDSWISRDNDKAENTDEPEYRDLLTDYPGIESVVQKEELGYRRVDRRTVYLILYNLYQFVAFLYVWTVLVVEWNRDGFSDASARSWATVGMAIKVSQLVQYFEVLHALVGYTKGSALFPMMQVTGRNFILFGYIDGEERIQSKPIVMCLFIVWSSVEIIRYPYYILTLNKCEVRLLTWLRYSVYVLLYPLGFMCEGLVMLIGLFYLDDKKRLSIELPNRWNFTFSMINVTKFYMTFVFLPGLYIVMKHMTKLRAKKLKAPRIRYSSVSETPRKRKTI